MFVCTYIYTSFWVHTGEVNAKRIRERYLQAVLRQDIPYFDIVGAGEIATRIQTDTYLVQQGISEKVALVVNFIVAFISGFILAYVQSWRLALALSSILPCIAITGGLMDRALSTYTQQVASQSEGIVQNALDKAAAGRTTITIAHLLSTIKDADVIDVMGDGLVLELGNHNELLACDGANSEGSDEKDGGEMPVGAQEGTLLSRRNTIGSQAGEAVSQKLQVKKDNEFDYTLPYIFKRMGLLNREGWRNYAIGSLFAGITGSSYPIFGIVYATGIEVFSHTDSRLLRRDGDRVALGFFIIAIISTICLGLQNYLSSSAAATLTAKLRSLSFKSILRQDIKFFDRDESSTGVLTSGLSENPQKKYDLAGITLGAIVQSIATLVCGCILGLVFIWKVGLVGMACAPLLVSIGYIRLQVVTLKDRANRRAHEESAQVACEAASANESLEGPLRRSNRTAMWSGALFSFSQSVNFFSIALVFWYEATLVSCLEFIVFEFFVGLMGTTFGAIQARNVFSFVPDMSSARGAGSDIIKLIDSTPEIDAESTDGKRIDGSKTHGHIQINKKSTSATQPGPTSASYKTYSSLSNLEYMLPSLVLVFPARVLSGAIYLDGERISDLNAQYYHKQITLVLQEPTLYAGTIRFNILLGAIKPKEQVTQEEIEAACRDANILDFIKSLPE
ncbi:hypothetical protein AX16_005451 [Volvariella volvacea WC 439]|nr:hypothetical protein AX16_005451 [Volvariella volvacea WC 439]